MFDDSCRQAMLTRLRSLKPDAERRWGRMTAPQMVVHLSDQLRHTLRLSPVESRPGMLRSWPARVAAIYFVPWPKGRIKGPPEAFKTQPASWDAVIAELEALLERFAGVGLKGDWPEHALLGHLSGRDWGVFVHKHFDHHFRQFGV